jgi:hypothetical protein
MPRPDLGATQKTTLHGTSRGGSGPSPLHLRAPRLEIGRLHACARFKTWPVTATAVVRFIHAQTQAAADHLLVLPRGGLNTVALRGHLTSSTSQPILSLTRDKAAAAVPDLVWAASHRSASTPF